MSPEEAGMKEKDVEKYLTQQTGKMGGRAYKFVSPGCSGVPDRLVALPGGKAGFLELKAPGKKARPEQEHRIRQLRALGFLAGTADSPAGVDAFLDSLAGKEDA